MISLVTYEIVLLSQSSKPLQQSKGKDLISEEIFNKYHHQDLTNQLAVSD